jgi:hypothetical protein
VKRGEDPDERRSTISGLIEEVREEGDSGGEARWRPQAGQTVMRITSNYGEIDPDWLNLS